VTQPEGIGDALFTVAPLGAASADQFVGFDDSTMDSDYFRYNPTGGSPSLPPGSPADSIDTLIRQTVAAGGSGAAAARHLQ
jgi:hypothetical protein